MLSIIIIVIFLVAITLLVMSWIDMMNHRRGYNVKGPIPLPIVGNGLLFIVKTTEILSLIRKLSKKYGDAFLVYFLSSPYVMTSHPRYIEPILMSSEITTKGRAYSYLKPWLGNGLLTAAGQEWKDHRKFLAPSFHYNVLQNFVPVFSKNSRILVDKLDKLADGKPVNIFPLIAMAALDNVTEAIIGRCVNSQLTVNSEYLKSIETLTQVLAIRMLVPLLSNDFVFNLTHLKKKQDAAISFLKTYSKTVVDARREDLKGMDISQRRLQESSDYNVKNKHIFLDRFLLAEEEDGTNINENAILAEVETFVFAGHDTTTSGIVYSLYCISTYPDIQEKVFEEQKRIFGDDLGRPTKHTDLIEMKYLELVIKESLRLYPPVPMSERAITKDIEIGGLKLRKGTTITVNIHQMQRHPDMYEDPLEFRPERFEAGSEDVKKPYFVFSAGPRNCIGQKFAMMELKVLISEVIRQFKLIPVDQEPQLCVDIVLRSKNGIHVGLLRR